MISTTSRRKYSQSDAKNFREAVARQEKARIYNRTSIVNIAKSLMHGDEYSPLCILYIKRHSPSLRDNATMRRGDCLVCISLAFSRMTFDHRVVFKRFQRTTRAPNDTSRLLSPFFFTTSRLLFSDVIPYVCFINHPPREMRGFFSRRFYSRLLIFSPDERAKKIRYPMFSHSAN